MKTYRLEGLKKKGTWVKYCDFADLGDLDILVNKMSSQNCLLKYDIYRVIKVITTQSVVYMGNIVESPKEVKEYVG